MSKSSKLQRINRVERSKLSAELKIIEKEHKNELKMHNSEVQRFKAKISKRNSDFNTFTECQPSGVQMYQTHNPGFCYRKNGAHKITSAFKPIQSINFKQLKNLLFTDDELDIEKLLCLHLLSTHQAESFKVPSSKVLKNTPEENLPLERLIARSKKWNKDKKSPNEVSELLPTYIVDVGHQCYSCTSFRTFNDGKNEEQQIIKDPRLSSRLVVNEKLQKIIESSLIALKKSKSEKFEQLIENAKDTIYLKKIFNKTSIQNFLKKLRAYTLITCSESYYLTPKLKQFPTHLEITTIFGHLESVILQIRKYLLQLPTINMKNELKNTFEFDTTLSDEDMISLFSQPINFEDGLKSIRSTRKEKSPRSIISRMSLMLKQKPTGFETNTSDSGGMNLIFGNLKAVKNARKTMDIFEDYEPDDTLSVSTFRPDIWSKILNRDYFKTNNTNRNVDESKNETHQKNAEIEMTTAEKNSQANEEIQENPDYSLPTNNKTLYIKRTSCYACQEKWKKSLPSPKISNYKKPLWMEGLDGNTPSANHLNRLYSMIREESYKLDSYDERYSSFNTNVKVRVPKEKFTLLNSPENEVTPTADSVEISQYDLDRIAHEIADKETRKKLNDFLENSL